MGIELSKAGGFLNNINNTFDQITRVAQGLLCIPSLLGKFLSGKNSLAGLASALTGSISNAVTNIVNSIVQNEIASIGNLFSQTLRQKFQNTLNDINTFNQMFQSVINLFSKIRSTLDYIKSTENCAYAASSLLSCIRSAANNLQKQISKPSSKIQEFSNKLNSSIAGKNGIVDNYVQSNLQAATKARLQINLQNFL